jgi:hypothetical protein
MAYGIKYQIPFHNRTGDFYEVQLSYEGFVGDPTVYAGTAQPFITRLDNPGDPSEALTYPVQSTLATINVSVEHNETLAIEDFIAESDQDIAVTFIKNTTEIIYRGWVVPERITQRFVDPPYNLSINCSDGIGQLKTTPLTDYLETEFEETNTIIAYISACLYKANNLMSGIRVLNNIYESSMDDRGVDPAACSLNQAMVHARTFLKDANTFFDCYATLEKICTKNWIIRQANGYWYVVRVTELQTTAVQQYMTEYSIDGQTVLGTTLTDKYNALIGLNEISYLIGANATRSLNYANKKARLTYRYEIPENLINNEKLQEFGAFIAPLSGIGFSAWQLVGWGHFKGSVGAETAETVKNAYIKREFDIYNNEIELYYAIEGNSGADNYIRHLNTDFYVNAGDELSLSFKHRLSANVGGGAYAVAAVLLVTASTIWTWGSANVWISGNDGPGVIRGVVTDQTDWQSFTIATDAIPDDGRIVIAFHGFNPTADAHYADIEVDYRPSINGALTRVTGDFNEYSQNKDYRQSADETVYISDAIKRILKGCLFRADGITAATPTWYRYGVTEEERFTALVCLGLFNLLHRKMLVIEGKIKGTVYQRSDTEAEASFSPITKFVFNDYNTSKQFLWVSGEVDYAAATLTGVFVEIFDPGEADGNYAGDDYEFNYLFN